MSNTPEGDYFSAHGGLGAVRLGARRPPPRASTIDGYTERSYNPTRHHSARAFRSPIQYEMMVLAAAQVL